MLIKHKGKEINTKHYTGYIDYDKINTIRNNYYTNNKDKALEQLRKILLEHKSKNNEIYNYYFEKVANDTKLGSDKWSINDALESDELIQMMLSKTEQNSKIFTNDNLIKNFKTAIRLGGKGYFRKPTQFPIKVMRQLLDEFTEPGDTYYDPCCGL